jgi:hypothetical protein
MNHEKKDKTKSMKLYNINIEQLVTGGQISYAELNIHFCM